MAAPYSTLYWNDLPLESHIYPIFTGAIPLASSADKKFLEALRQSESPKTRVLIALVALSVTYSGYVVFLAVAGHETSPDLNVIWNFVWLVLLAMWIEIDSRGRTDVYRPFDFAFLIYIFGLISAPWYFWKNWLSSGMQQCDPVRIVGLMRRLSRTFGNSSCHCDVRVTSASRNTSTSAVVLRTPLFLTFPIVPLD